MIECTISTSGSTGTGLKKCSPITLCGCVVPAPSFMIGTDEVFEARNCASGSSSSSRRNMSRLSVLVLDDRLDRRVGALDVVERRREGEVLQRAPHGPPRTLARRARRGPATSRSPPATSRSAPRRPRPRSRPRPSARTPPRSPSPSGRHRSLPLAWRGHAISRRDQDSAPPGRRRLARDGARKRYAASASTGTTQTQLGSFVEPGRTIRPAPRSAAACRATSVGVLPVVDVLRHRRLRAVRIDVDHVVHDFSVSLGMRTNRLV